MTKHCEHGLSISPASSDEICLTCISPSRKLEETIVLEYAAFQNYQDITEAAINLVSEWPSMDMSAQDWAKLSDLINKLSDAVNALP